MASRAFLATVALIGGFFATVARHHTPSPHATPRAAPRAQARATPSAVSPTKLLGQRIMVGMNGTSANATLLQTVREGRVGSVILFGANITGRAQLEALTGSLQHAARQGGNPPLLIAVDQEGGQVKRLPAGPPDLSPPQIAASGSVAVASREGARPAAT